MSPSPPLRRIGKDALFEVGLLTPAALTYLLSAPSHPLWDSGSGAADFVAVYSCEGSGGFAPLFPYTSGASWLAETGPKATTVTQLKLR
jgi:hypothetical protein